MKPITVEFLGDTKGLKQSTNEVESHFGKMGNNLKTAGKAIGIGAGAAVGGALAMGISNTINIEAAQAKLSAQLGAGSQMAADAGKIAGSLYGNAYGENLEQVNEAVKTVIQSGALMEGATNEQIESITGQAMSLAQAFGVDVTEAMRAVGQMVKTGMVPDAQAGMDLITRAFQQFGPAGADVLDTINEYSTQFRKLGIDGPMAMGLVNQMMKAGARDTDVAADALKEFSIRAIDGSKGAADAYKALGLDAKAMTAQIAKGGPEASAGLATVVERLKGMKDPVAQSAAAVGLFGTQSEDLGAALLAINPATAVAGLGEVAGASAKVDQALGETAQAKITSYQRGFEALTVSLVSTEGPLGEVAAGVMAFGMPGIDIVGNLGMVAVAMRGLGLASMFSAPWIRALWAALFGPIGLVIAAVAIGVGLIIYHWDSIVAGLRWMDQQCRAILNAIGGFISGVFSWIGGVISGAWDWAKNATGAAWDWISGKVQGGIDFVKGILNWFGGLGGMFSGWWNAAVSATAGAINNLIGWLQGLPGRAVAAVGDLAGRFWDIGMSVMRGIGNGISAGWSWLVGKVKSIAADLFNAAKAVLGIASPSKLFRDKIGKMVPEGMAIGITANSDSVRQAIGKLTSMTASAAVTPLVPASRSAAARAGGGPVQLDIRGDGSGISEVLIEVLRKAVRTKGGDVQLVLGRTR